MAPKEIIEYFIFDPDTDYLNDNEITQYQSCEYCDDKSQDCLCC